MLQAKEEIDRQILRIEKAVNELSHNVRNAASIIGGLARTDKRQVRVKSDKVFMELLVPWHAKLKMVMEWVCSKWPGEVMITSGHRIDGSLHSYLPLRPVDLRSREFGDPRNVEYMINKHWKYNHPSKKLDVCVYHRTVLCGKCREKFEVDQEIGVISSTTCPNCQATKEHLKDFGPHLHIQVRDSSYFDEKGGEDV